MSDAVIKVENLSKKYVITHQTNGRGGHGTLRDAITDGFRSVGKRFTRRSNVDPSHEEFWALNDVSFEIKQGDRVAIIGRNGAGKSTLLKILSRITEPTQGRITIEGRVASLLEVGTGFHAELTGRENIFLNGAILGMSKQEIKRKFDEIVAFSEVEKFLDTPVKRYSSGMYVRLAFAVAAHLEPEILIVDEVLAVGDMEFQQKCLGKMESVANEGRTVIFVSHNMSAVQKLCERSILLRSGKLISQGETKEIVKDYLSYLTKTAEDPFGNNPERSGSGEIRLTGAELFNSDGIPTTHPVSGENITVALEYETSTEVRGFDVIMTIYNHLGVAVTNLNTRVSGFAVQPAMKGKVYCEIENLPLPFGEYRIATAVQYNGRNADYFPTLLVFEITASRFFSTFQTPDIQYSTALVAHSWRSETTVSSKTLANG
jgi:lipopolysaccharide transport system ATP-binding protein